MPLSLFVGTSFNGFKKVRLFGILSIQRDQKDEGFAAFASSEREAATVFAEVRADLRVRSPLQKRLTIPPRLVTVGILLVHRFFFFFFFFVFFLMILILGRSVS